MARYSTWILFIALSISGCAQTQSSKDPDAGDGSETRDPDLAPTTSALPLPPPQFPVLRDRAWAEFRQVDGNAAFNLTLQPIKTWDQYGRRIEGVAVNLSGPLPSTGDGTFGMLAMDRCLDPAWKWMNASVPDTHIYPALLNDAEYHVWPPFLLIAGYPPFDERQGGQVANLTFGDAALRLERGDNKVVATWGALQAGPSRPLGAWHWHSPWTLTYGGPGPFPTYIGVRKTEGSSDFRLDAWENEGKALGRCNPRRDLGRDSNADAEYYRVSQWATVEDPDLPLSLNAVLTFIKADPALVFTHAYLARNPNAHVNDWVYDSNYARNRPGPPLNYIGPAWRIQFFTEGITEGAGVACVPAVDPNEEGIQPFVCDEWQIGAGVQPNRDLDNFRLVPYDRWLDVARQAIGVTSLPDICDVEYMMPTESIPGQVGATDFFQWIWCHEGETVSYSFVAFEPRHHFLGISGPFRNNFAQFVARPQTPA